MHWMFKWAVRKAFSLSLSSLMLFSASSISQFSKSCRIRVLHQIMARTQPGVSAAPPGVVASGDTEMGADKTCPFPQGTTVFSWGSCSEPQESQHSWMTIKLLWITDYLKWHMWIVWLNIHRECKRIVRYRKTAPSTWLWCPCMNGQKSTPCRTVVICNDGILITTPRDLCLLNTDSTGKHEYNIAVEKIRLSTRSTCSPIALLTPPGFAMLMVFISITEPAKADQ